MSKCGEWGLNHAFLTHWCLVTWKSNELIVDSVNTLRTRQNGCHFQDGIFKWIFLNENVWIEFWLKFRWSLFLGVWLTLFQHWFRQWLGANQATSHYLNWWWLDCRCIYVSLSLNDLMACYMFILCNWNKNNHFSLKKMYCKVRHWPCTTRYLQVTFAARQLILASMVVSLVK